MPDDDEPDDERTSGAGPRRGLTIGAFARASRLSAKALRRYDELGLLRPARVDPYTGYRYYDETQLERARLVAWLRRVGMPLARIRHVCDLRGTDAVAAGREIEAYWARVEYETAARRDLATFLVDHLTLSGDRPPAGKGVEAMEHTNRSPGMLGIRYASRSDRGLVRPTNQDTAYADDGLLAVADGYGAEGARASSAAVEALRSVAIEGGDLLNALTEGVVRANAAVGAVAGASGTTLTAMLWTGSQLALVHIGDTRAYLARNGAFFRITHDHTVVQSLIDGGALTAEEAESHPQRSMLLRSLDGTEEPVRPELRLHDAREGDRYLLCSDGLSTVVPPEEVRRVVTAETPPEDAVTELLTLAQEAGAPDNVACVVADVVHLLA
ncbi:MerR family transcriptional regulator [Streptomyces liangshanensis]|uniref:MerR family transcriptional regulator n=1 Tax=Streptomyces liangshanensis TaxID=2717324 RepID=A0A6G9GZP3_9ACTN|nr:MerR family transcriptional regulator [Streptomyces liangshanensis]QIQ03715.1 MerR family transcriptional regulator [Streptomyces liangshanensis]